MEPTSATVEQGGEETFTSVFETEGAGATAPAATTSESPASAGLAADTAGTPAAQALGSTKSDTTQPAPLDIASTLEKMLQEEAAGPQAPQKVSKEAELAKMLEGIQPGTPAHERIRALANARAEAQEANSQFQSQMQQMQSYVGQVQQAAQQALAQKDQTIASMQSQLTALAANFESLKQLAPKPPQDPSDVIRQQWQDGVRGIIEEQRKAWQEKELSPIQKELEGLRQWKSGLETKQVADRYSQDALDAIQKVALRGIELPAGVSEKAMPKLAAYALAEMLNTNCTPQQAAQNIRQTILQVSAAFVRNAMKGASGALKTGKEAPTATTSRRVDAQGSAMPTLEQIQAQGHKDELDYLSSLEG